MLVLLIVTETEERCFWVIGLVSGNKVLRNLVTYGNHFILHKYRHIFFFSLTFLTSILIDSIAQAHQASANTSSIPSSFCLLLCSKSNVTCFRWHPKVGPLWIKRCYAYAYTNLYYLYSGLIPWYTCTYKFAYTNICICIYFSSEKQILRLSSVNS